MPAARLCVVLATSTAAAAFAGGLHAQTEREFAAGLDQVRAAMAQGSWSAARRHLLALLEEHEGAAYARARQVAIAEDYRRCAFHLTHRVPPPGGLIHGDLVYYRERTGAIKLRYTKATLRDFELKGTDGAEALFHPVELAGPHTITLKGRHYPSQQLGERLFVCLQNGSMIDISLGHSAPGAETYVPMQIALLARGGFETVLAAPKQPPVRADQPWEVRVKVGTASIEVERDGTVIMRAAKPRGVFGRFGVAPREFTELEVEGTVTSAWLRGVVDAHMQDKLARFQAAFDARRELPAWLFEGVAAAAAGDPRATRRPAAARGDGHGSADSDTADSATTGSDSAGSDSAGSADGADGDRNAGSAPAAAKLYPGEIAAAHVAAINQAAALTNAREFDKARAYLESLTAERMPRGARAYLLAICHSGLGEPDAALRHCDIACDADPSFADSHVLRARLYDDLGRRDDAERQLRAVIARHPRDELAYRALALQLFERGQPHAAKATIEAARRAGADVARVAELERMLTMALRGPDWPQVYDYKSNHYHVLSDLDHRTCVTAARLLEQALVSYKSQLVGVEPPERPFVVYLFSGQAGYNAYCKDILGAAKSHTAGLYSRALKQLLVWNLPNHQDMLETVRHEGFHQYLDGALDDPPAWFNEGLALYYERPPRGGDRVSGGVVRDDLLAALHARPQKMLPLATFLYQSDEQFYAGHEITYPQSWAFLHFLRETTRANRKLFHDVFQALRAGGPRRAALDSALRGVDLDRLDTAFRQHVMALGRADRSAAPAGG